MKYQIRPSIIGSLTAAMDLAAGPISLSIALIVRYIICNDDIYLVLQ